MNQTPQLADQMHFWVAGLAVAAANAPTIPATARADLQRMLDLLQGTAVSTGQQTPHDTRLLLALGLATWCVPAALPATPPPDLLPSLAAHALLPYVLLSSTRLPVLWQSDLLRLLGIDMKTLVAQLHLQYHMVGMVSDEAARASLTTALSSERFRNGILVLADRLRESRVVDSFRAVLEHDIPGIVLLRLFEDGELSAAAWQHFCQEPPPNAFFSVVEALLVQGDIHLVRREYAQALDVYNQVIAYDATNAEAFCKRGQAYLKLNKVSRAWKDLEAALKLQPDYAEAHYHQGIVYQFRGEDRRAQFSFRKAAQLGYQAP
ncbi:MAG: tetratricopeptide repeat protein [Chloroflexaceae bacterium]|nr:tetratricopeptide repeat protein [Chloroflexaceae bacterium]